MPDNKITETGTTKTPLGTAAKADQPTKSGVITGDKAPDPKEKSMLANTPTAKTIAETERAKANAPAANEEPMDAGISELKGEILQGDSFRITLKRGSKTLLIPVPVEGSNNVVILDNTFKIIAGIMDAKTERELDDKFASFIQ